MAITLLRRQSDVPTVQGQDDSRMMRYAVAHDGVTRGYQSECGYRISGSTFTVLGGEIIVNGWQAIIDSLGCAVQAISSSTKMYYIVYVEYDLRTPDQQSVTIKSTYTSGAFPEITPGDDLTENPNGLRRLALYRFTIQNGVISGVERLFSYCEVGDSKNVTVSINGKAITSIFESDGTTVKRASNAAKLNNKNLYRHEIAWHLDDSSVSEVSYSEVYSSMGTPVTDAASLQNLLSSIGSVRLYASNMFKIINSDHFLAGYIFISENGGDVKFHFVHMFKDTISDYADMSSSTMTVTGGIVDTVTQIL